MKILTLSIIALLALLPVAGAGDEIPSSNMIEQAKWARDTEDLSLRTNRLEKFLGAFIPLEDGVKVETEYEDSSSALAVTGSAWCLLRAYVEAEDKVKALKMIGWLQKHDSKSDLFPKKTKND